MEPKGY